MADAVGRSRGLPAAFFRVEFEGNHRGKSGMKIGIIPQTFMERRNRGQNTRGKRGPRMRVDHSPLAAPMDCPTESYKSPIPGLPLVEAAGRHVGISIDRHHPGTGSGAVAIPQRAAEPSPLPQRTVAEHRRTVPKLVDDQPRLHHIRLHVKNQSAGKPDGGVSAHPAHQLAQPVLRKPCHLTGEKEQSVSGGQMPGDHLIDAARAVFGGAGEHFHPAPLQASQVGRGFVPALPFSHHRHSHPQAALLRSLRDVSHQAVEVIDTDALSIDNQMNAPARLIAPADAKS